MIWIVINPNALAVVEDHLELLGNMIRRYPTPNPNAPAILEANPDRSVIKID